MKKLVLMAITLLTSGAAYALPLGNPAEPALYRHGLFCDDSPYCQYDPCCCWWDAWSFRVGYYGDFVFNRNLRVRGSGINQGTAIRETCLNTNAGYLAVNFCNRIDVFGTLGSSDLRVRTSEITYVFNGNAESELFTNNHFSWSVGGRAVLWTCSCFTLGIEAQYFRFTPELTKYISYSDGQFNYFNENNQTRYQEWQVGLGVSYAVTTACPKIALIPYGGVMWSRVRWDTNNFQFIKLDSEELFTIFNMKNNKRWAFAVGGELVLCDVIGVRVEGRWAAEKAIHVLGQFRF